MSDSGSSSGVNNNNQVNFHRALTQQSTYADVQDFIRTKVQQNESLCEELNYGMLSFTHCVDKIAEGVCGIKIGIEGNSSKKFLGIASKKKKILITAYAVNIPRATNLSFSRLQHGNEWSAMGAALWLIELILKTKKSLRDYVYVIFPVMNPVGYVEHTIHTIPTRLDNHTQSAIC